MVLWQGEERVELERLLPMLPEPLALRMAAGATGLGRGQAVRMMWPQP